MNEIKLLRRIAELEARVSKLDGNTAYKPVVGDIVKVVGYDGRYEPLDEIDGIIGQTMRLVKIDTEYVIERKDGMWLCSSMIYLTDELRGSFSIETVVGADDFVFEFIRKSES